MTTISFKLHFHRTRPSCRVPFRTFPEHHEPGFLAITFLSGNLSSLQPWAMCQHDLRAGLLLAPTHPTHIPSRACPNFSPAYQHTSCRPAHNPPSICTCICTSTAAHHSVRRTSSRSHVAHDTKQQAYQGPPIPALTHLGARRALTASRPRLRIKTFQR